MAIGTAIAIYFIIWWLTLFVSLPFKMKSQVESGSVTEGTEAAAPQNPQILKRMIWNTVLSAIVFLIYWLVVYYFGYGLNVLPEFIPIRKL